MEDMIDGLTNERGCGTRTEGDIYMECLTSPDGEPPEYFLVDSPEVIDPGSVGLSAIQPLLIDDDCHCCNGTGVERIAQNEKACFVCKGKKTLTHVLDWIGETFYPTPAHFIEELRYLGCSRKIPRTVDFSRLVPGSRMLFVHAKASADNYQDYYKRERDWMNNFSSHDEARASSVRVPERYAQFRQPYSFLDCPKVKVEHSNLPALRPLGFCARFFYQDQESGEPVDGVQDKVKITLPCNATFYALKRPPSIEPQYQPAFFMWLPIHRLAIIRDSSGNRHEEAAQSASKSSLPFAIVED